MRPSSTRLALALSLVLAAPCAGLHATVGRAARPALSHGASPAFRADRISMKERRAAETNAEVKDGSGGVRQLLGLKGASADDGKSFLNWKIRLQLMKPATWVPLIWGVACGAAASGNYHAVWNLFGDAPTTDSWAVVGEDTIKALCAMTLSGPILCGFTQTINDWYDRELDAINEPYRPIPSGKISPTEVYVQIGALLVGGLVLATQLDAWAHNEWPVITLIATFGSFMAYIYSAPPLKLKVKLGPRTASQSSPFFTAPLIHEALLHGTPL